MKWFRLYTDILEDPKVQKLPPELFKFWVNILCLASKHEGKLPSIDDVSFSLRLPLHETELAFHSLEKANLISEYNGSKTPHNWRKRQYKSDTSTERVKRFRNAKRNVTVTPPDTDTDTDTEQSKKVIKKTFKPPNVSDQTWLAFQELRKRKKAPISDLVLTRILGEADKANISLEEALQECCERGWNSFKADWYNNSKGNNNGKQHNNAKPNPHDDFTKGIALGLAELNKQQEY